MIKWSKDNSDLADAQFKFRQGVRTLDTIFSLQGFIEKHLSNNEKSILLFCRLKKGV